MAIRDDVLSVREAAHLLGVSERRVQQMTASGDLALAARGLVDRTSLNQHLATRQGSRGRAWSTRTAWAAAALLTGVEVDWLGATQMSRLRNSLLSIDAQALVSRSRNRADTHRYAGHDSTAPRLRSEIVLVHRASELGIVGDTGQFDGYVATSALADLVRRHALIEDTQGQYTLRATDFDLDNIAAIANAGGIPMLAALDSGESLDPRERGVGLETLGRALAQFRG